jgi:hypothetical protein
VLPCSRRSPGIAAAGLTVALAALLCASPLNAQVLPTGPVQAFDGRVRLGGEVVATFGADDDDAFFNYTDYEHNALRLLRLALSGAWYPGERFALVGEIRSENVSSVIPFAAYVRIRPWKSRPFDIQAGRIPPVFGAFGRRTYGPGNPIVGYPLAYQYLTSLRPDSVPATADDLLRMRGRGWLSSFPVGSQVPAAGVPLISAFRWDTGVQVRWSGARFDLAGAITSGTLSSPRVDDDNDGKQGAVRAAVRPAVGLVLGVSGSRGEWLSDSVPTGAQRTFVQSAVGVDGEYSRDHWIVRGEAVWSRWDLPFAAAASSGGHVEAWGLWGEGYYRLTPRVFVAGRVDHLGFSTIRDRAGISLPWDGPVDRLEATAGYYLQRNLVVRAGVQSNWREAGRVRSRTFPTAQVAWWF